MKIIYFFILIFLVFGICYASEFLVDKDGNYILLEDDFTWKYVTTPINTTTPIPSPTPTVTNAKYADEAVEVWDSSLGLTKVNHGVTDAVTLYVHYKNNTNKRIVGISVYILITNPFGKIVLEKTIDDEILVEPFQRFKNDTFWYFENNQFIDNEPYDRMWQMAQKGIAKIKTKVLKVVFEDGTVLNAKPIKKK